MALELLDFNIAAKTIEEGFRELGKGQAGIL